MKDIWTQINENIVFQGGPFQLADIKSSDLLRLQPYGIQISADGLRPVLLLRDEKNEHTMPVTLNPLEAGVAITQSNKSIAPTSPHKVTELLLETLKIKFESCIFVEIKGPHLLVDLKLFNHPTHKNLRVRADEAMSLCLHLGTPIFATADFMARTRVMSAQLDGTSKEFMAKTELLTKNHKYMM
jgi:uncharacterized protein